MQLREGQTFDRASIDDVVAFLERRALRRFAIDPERLRVEADSRSLRLLAVNGGVREYPLRKSFLYKLLRWYSFPLSQLKRMSMETVVSLCNDYLLSIRSGPVWVTVEDGEALTVTSRRYVHLPDVEVLKALRHEGRVTVTRNDFFLRAYSQTLWESEPIAGDRCGFGVNVLHSETGFRALSVHAFMLRYVCSNGAVLPSGTTTRMYHGDVTARDMLGMLTSRILEARGEFAAVAARLPSLRRPPSPAEREQLTAQLRRVVPAHTAAAVIERQVPGETLYALLNRITEAAKAQPPDIRLEMELLAGGMFAVSG